jgi:hypothetical protein
MAAEQPRRVSDEIGAGLEGLPVFQLNNLIDELGRSSDEDVMDDELQSVQAALGPGMAPSSNDPGHEATASFLRCAREAGLVAICDAMNFCGLQAELPKLFGESGVTILAPTDGAFAHLSAEARGNARLIRQLLLAHICLSVTPLAELESKRCAVAIAGQVQRSQPPRSLPHPLPYPQPPAAVFHPASSPACQTHAVYTEEPNTYIGTGQLGRQDLRFEGGVIHEVRCPDVFGRGPGPPVHVQCSER